MAIKITVNDKTLVLEGNHIRVRGHHQVMVDGQPLFPDAAPPVPSVVVTVVGDVRQLETEDGDVTVQGNVGTIRSSHGHVRACNVAGGIHTYSGNVTCGHVRGGIRSTSGRVLYAGAGDAKPQNSRD